LLKKRSKEFLDITTRAREQERGVNMARGRPKKLDKPEEVKNLNARIPKDLAVRLKVYCAQNEITVQDFLIEAIKEKMKTKK